jgi:hypothetical protein
VHDAAFFTVFRDIVRTFEDAILTAEALVFQMFDDARSAVLDVRLRRAASHARRFGAMMACRGHMLDDRIFAGSPLQQSDRAPGLVFIQPVLVVAGGHAGLAAGALVQIHFKGVLLPGSLANTRLPGRDHLAVSFLRRIQRMALVQLREFLDGGDPILLPDAGGVHNEIVV